MNPSSYFRKELLQSRKDWPGLLVTVLAPVPVLWIFGGLDLPRAAPAGFPTMDPPAFAVVLTVWLAGSAAAATSILRERVGGTLQRLSLTPYSGLFLVVAKATLFLPVALAQASVTYAACRWFLAGAFGGPPVAILVTFAALAEAAFCLGLLFSATCGSITQVAGATTIASMASILWSGFFKPTSGLGWVGPLAEVLPFTVAYRALRTGSDSGFSYSAWAWLLAAMLVTVAGAAFMTRVRSRQAPT